MRRALWALGLALLLQFPAIAFEASIAEFFVTSQNEEGLNADPKAFNDRLFSSLVGLDTKGRLGFRFRTSKDTKGSVRSALDAAQVCEINGWGTLVYGQLTERQASYEAEIEIYSHGDRKLVKTILLRSSVEDYDSLPLDCARKIYGFFSSELSLERTETRYEIEKNSWIIDQGAYWWGVNSPWNSSFETIVGYRGTYSLRLGDPLWMNGEWAWLQEYGLYTSFAYGMNAPDVISSRLYDMEFGPLLNWDFVWQRKQEITATIAPLARLHYLDYQPQYSDRSQNAIVWYGALIDAGYRLWVNSARSFGLGVEVGASSYLATPFFLEYHLGVSLLWKGGFK